MLPRTCRLRNKMSADDLQKLREHQAKERAKDPEKYDYRMDEMRQDAARGDVDEPDDDEE